MVVGIHTKDFGEQNAHLLSTIKDFADVYRNNEKDVASRILWSAFFVSVIANEKNPFKNHKDDEERRAKVKEEFCPQYGLKHLSLEKLFSTLVLSKQHRLYNIHLRKYEEMVSILDELDLTTDADYKKYIETTQKLEKISKFYDELEKKYTESITKSSGKEGGGSFTIAEKRNMQKGSQ
jgi:hypothetical protein